MPLKKNQFSIGKLIYWTMFVATFIAGLLTPPPYGFVYFAVFILVVGSYVAWVIFRPFDDEIVEPWDADLPPTDKDINP